LRLAWACAGVVGIKGAWAIREKKSMSCTRGLWIGVAALAAWGANGALADAATVYGEAKGLGDGFAQVYAELDGAGAPQVIGVSFDPGLLAGLPTMPNTWSRCFDKDGNGPDRCARRMQRRLRAPLHAASRAGAARERRSSGLA
jgi:hypothetical protein